MQAGQMLLQYRLLEKIGEGGMGLVWKALDTSLQREVAIKVLPHTFSQDSDRLARFEREARLLASLNHPNIATLHGLHQAPGPGDEPVRFLAMELVEGEDLAVRLGRGPLPVDEALPLAIQIASALEAAHTSGVVHRDLKPANIVLTPDGKAKVLDFGLAKAVQGDGTSSSGASATQSMSPTVTSLGTAAGMILGTAAYMSPEQARGKPVDRRSDLWSFGCVLYESLTGQRLFRGETVSDSLAAILRKEPDWTALPENTPPMVRLLLRRCLTRDPDQRLHDAGDARIELEQAITDPDGSSIGLSLPAYLADPAPRAARWLPWGVAAAAALAAAFFAWQAGAPSPAPGLPSRLTIPVPGFTEFGDLDASPPAISPDGRAIVFGVAEDAAKTRLWLRPLDSFEAVPLADTDGADYAFWSPDSRQIGFFVGGRLRRIEVATGRVQAIGSGDGSSYPRGAAWNDSGQVIFAPNSNSGIHLIAASGTTEREITTLDPAIPDCSHRWPVFLPDGEHFLFLLWTNDLRAQEEYGGIYLTSLSGDEPPRKILSDLSSVAYVPQGYLLLVRGESLVAIPFDADTGQVTGEARVITDQVLLNQTNGHAAFSASSNGTVVFAVGQAFIPATLRWYDRKGTATAAPLEPAPFANVRLAPGGNLAVAGLPAATGDNEIWVIDLDRGVRTRLFQARTQADQPVWSGDGERVMYATQESGVLEFASRPANGSGGEEIELTDGMDKMLFDWSRDGRTIAYWPFGSGSGTPDIWLYSVDRKQTNPFTNGEAMYQDARFSPDGRWIAYISDDSDRVEVFVQAIVDDGESLRPGARFQVSTAGGHSPHWRDDAGEITYIDLEGRMMAVSVRNSGDPIVLGAPVELFTIDELVVSGEPSGDHERFLLATRDAVGSEPLRVIQNWTAGL